MTVSHSSTNNKHLRGGSSFMSVQRVLLAGLIASLVLGMFEMLYGAITGLGFWSPVVFIAATIVRGLQSVGTPVEFQPMPVLLGLMGHMMNSVILAFVFSWLIGPDFVASPP